MAPAAADAAIDQLQQAAGPGRVRNLFSRRNLIGAAGFVASRAALGLGPVGALGVGLAARYVYGRTEQRVPFTRRRHVILLPSTAEVLLGQHLYEQFLAENTRKRTLLDASHKDTKLVSGVAQRIVAAVQQGRGGGYQKHIQRFSWRVSVVKEEVPNAYVFPGGFIVVHTGLLDLLKHDEDLIAMVLGHEVAHALARHSAEKIGMGLAISMLAQMAAAVAGAANEEAARQRMQQLEAERRATGYHRAHSRAVGYFTEAEDEGEEQQQLPYGASGAAPMGGRYPSVPPTGVPQIRYNQQQQQAQQRRPGGGGGGDGPPQLPPWISEQVLRSLTSVLLELPFSRRAETEADLVGLKLASLAGFNASKGPQAFELLATVTGGRGRHTTSTTQSLIATLGCTHPDSTRRAEVLKRELEFMRQKQNAGDADAIDSVGQKVSYFAL